MASAAAIQRYLELGVAGGLDYIRTKENRPDLPANPIPLDFGKIIVEECLSFSPYIVNSDLVAAQIKHESASLQSLIARNKNNFSGYGAENDDPYGKAHTFESPREGVRMQVRHLIGYIYGRTPYASTRFSIVEQKGYAGKGTTPAGLEQRWAYSKPATYNATSIKLRYGSKLADGANTILAIQDEMGVGATVLRVAVAAGHHNTSGGSRVEYDVVDELCELYYDCFRYQGVDVRSYTPDGPDPDDLPGDGDYPGDLYDAARNVVNWANEGWKADFYLEVHTQGGPKVPGMFGIYPDWGSDVDIDARDYLIPRMVRKMSAASGIGIWTDGVMSEKQTAVGAGGDRLGVFRATEEINDDCTRIIFEHAAHDVPSDLEKIRNPDVQLRLIRAAVEAVLEHYGHPIKNWNADQPEPQIPAERAKIELNGFEIVEGFKGFSEFLMSVKFRGVDLFWLVLGNPLENERGITLKNGQAGSIQRFERGWLIWDSNEPDEWSITLAQTRDLPQYGVTLE